MLRRGEMLQHLYRTKRITLSSSSLWQQVKCSSLRIHLKFWANTDTLGSRQLIRNNKLKSRFVKKAEGRRQDNNSESFYFSGGLRTQIDRVSNARIARTDRIPSKCLHFLLIPCVPEDRMHPVLFT